MMRIRTTGSLSAGGHLEATAELEFGGINDNAFRSAFAQMKPDDRRRLFERFVNQTVPGSTLKDLKLEPVNMLDSSVPVHATIAFAADGMTAIGHGKAIVKCSVDRKKLWHRQLYPGRDRPRTAKISDAHRGRLRP